ncbi:tyrosine-type recombinase/integrase [Bradyrhizobium sp. USDA 4508]
MGTIVSRKRADGSRSHTGQIVIKRKGQILHREAETFDKHADAVSWLRDRESELAKPGVLEKLTRQKEQARGKTLTDAIDKYTAETNKKIGRTKEQVLNAIKGYDIADLECAAVTSQEIVTFAKELLDGGRQPSTVGNYISHLSAIFQIARPAWGYALDEKQMADAQTVLTKMGIIGKSKQRDRRPTLDELDQLMGFFVERSIKRPQALPMHRVIALAIFSTRRQEELARQQMADVEIEHKRMLVRDMKHPGEKIGNDVWCELVDEAVAIIEAMGSSDFVFPGSTADAISASFTRACALLGIDDLHFHDLRHEGISRLFEMGRNIPQAACVSGHRSWASLQRYAHIRASGDKFKDWKWLAVVTKPYVPGQDRKPAASATKLQLVA